MKKSTKTMMLTAIGLILVGGCFYAGAWAAGATGFYRDFGGFTISIGLNGLQIGPKEWNHHQQVIDSVVVQEGTAEYATSQEVPPEAQQWAETPKITWSNGEKSGEIPLAWESLTHLDINLTAADFNIVPTESGSFLQWEGIEPGTLSFTLEDGCLYLVQEEPYKGFLANLTHLPAEDMEITLGLPDGVCIEEMSLHSGMGDLKIEDGAVGAASIELGLGDFKAEGVYFRWLEAQVGTGDVKLENCSSDELNLYSGLGKVEYEGILHGTANMESGLGDVKLTLDEGNGNALSDYSLDLSSGLGEVKVNGKSYGTTYELTVENAPLLELHTGMGDINLKTK